MENPNSDKLVWMQNGEPGSLFCNDETDGESIRVCNLISEGLLAYKPGTGDVIPALAKEWSANKDLTEWTFKLADGLKWSDGTPVTSDDVVVTWTAEWDAANPLHKGRTGVFDYFSSFFTSFLNPPPTPTPKS